MEARIFVVRSEDARMSPKADTLVKFLVFIHSNKWEVL